MTLQELKDSLDGYLKLDSRNGNLIVMVPYKSPHAIGGTPAVEEVEPYNEVVTVTKYKPIKNIMKIEKFDPEIHTQETHWSYRGSDLLKEQFMLRANRFFGCNGTTDTEAKEVDIPVMFGGYVYKDAETGIWGSYLEWEYVNLLKPNRIFSFMFINRRKDCCGRNNSFQSSRKNLCDYTLCLEYC